MESLMKNGLAQRIHQEALMVAGKYKRCEIELIEILQKVERHRIYYSLGYSSLFRYACEGLGLAEEVAYIFINVARKATQVPQLKEEIRRGTLTVTKAKKISSVINSENQGRWLELARTASKAKLEREVALHSPNGGVRDKMTYVNHQLEIHENTKIVAATARVQLQVGISEQLMLDIRRAQDVLSQKLRRPASLEEVLRWMTEQILHRQDPIRIAQRQKMKGRLQGDADSNEKRSSGLGGENGMGGPGTEKKFFRKPNSTQQVPGPANAQQVPGPANAQQVPGPANAQQVPGPANAQQVPGPVAVPWSKNMRVAVPRKLKHEIVLRFDGRCSHQDEQGWRCAERKFLEIHHVVPVSQGGRNELSNLKLLCSGHHKSHHL